MPGTANAGVATGSGVHVNLGCARTVEPVVAPAFALPGMVITLC